MEWITLNSDSRNSNTQELIQQVKSCLHPNSNTNLNETVNQPLISSIINDDVRSLLSDLVIEVDKKLSEPSSMLV